MMTHEAFAVPAVPWPVEKTQPDGTKITVYLRGDEKVHWMESLDGYTLMYDAKKYIVYAEQDADNNMVPSKAKFNRISAAPSTVKKGIRYSGSQIKAFEQIWEVTSDQTPQKAAPIVGERKALCVLMSFSDKIFGKEVSEFETLFNQVGFYPSDNSTKGSVRDFFKENSYGQLDFTVTIKGPYLAPNTAKYYASHEQEFAEAAARAADADVNYADFATDGSLETFHILFAGYGDESIDNGNQIWSHKWQLARPIYLDGVRISVYSCSPELRGSSGTNTTYIGVVCHELSHVFGAPDYYDTGSTGFAGSGNWDLMAGGSWNDSGRQPGHINMFQKILYGWVDPVELTSFTEVSDMPASALNPVAYTIKANANGELYVLENRQKVGFDTSLPGHGLLVWHVHPNALNGKGSNASHPQQLYPVAAASTVAIPTGTVASYGSINSAGTPFPGTAGKSNLTATTTPAMFTWTGPQTIAKPITEINEAQDGTIAFKFLDGSTVPVTDLQPQVTGGNVTLTWTAPNHADVRGYKIYRDNVLQYTINNKNTTTYTQIGVTNGRYNYCVAALYEATESERACVSVSVTGASDSYCLPITDLQANSTLDKAFLNWTAPFNGGWQTIAGAGSNVWSFGSEFTFFAGTLWEPEHLKGLDGFEITQVQFYLYERTAGTSHTIQIWTVDEDGMVTKVCNQPYSYTSTTSPSAKSVTLTSPLTIDASKGYIVGVEIHTLGTGCFVTDAGPIVPGRNWMCEDGEWFTMEEAGFDNNFFLQTYLSPGNPSSLNSNVVLDSRTQKNPNRGIEAFIRKAQSNTSKRTAVKSDIRTIDEGPQSAAPAVTKYIIYRDGESVGESTTTSFEDSGLTSGTVYSYCISAVYSNGCSSEGICTEVTTLSPVNPYKPAENFKANLDDNKVTLSWNVPFAGGIFGYSTLTTSITSYLTTGIMAARFTKDELKKLLGLQLTKVRFATHNSVTTSNSTYILRIYAGAKGNEPERVIYEQEIVSFTGGAWNTVTLTTPIDIDVYEDFWIGIVVAAKDAGAVYRMACDISQPAVDGKGNVMYFNNAWSTLSGMGGGDYNWAILGVAESANSPVAPTYLSHNDVSEFIESQGDFKSTVSERIEVPETISLGDPSLAIQVYATPAGYLIFRDDVEIGTVAADVFTFDDFLSETGDYKYSVAAQYAGGNSDLKNVIVSFVSECDVKVTNLVAAINENTVSLDWDFKQTVQQLDDISITKNAAPVFNIYKDEVLIAQNFSGNHYEDVLGKYEHGIYTYSVSFVGDYCESDTVSVDVNVPVPCREVLDLTADIDGNVVTLNWEIDDTGFPATLPAYTFNVYRNNTLVAEGLTDLTYEDTLEETGKYTYCVTMLIDESECESGAECADPILFTELVTNLQSAFTATDDIKLTWSGITGATEYKLYRDNMLIATRTATEYVDVTAEYLTEYEYCIVAVSQYGESGKACISITLPAPFTISQQPAPGTVCEEKGFLFTVAANNTGLSYQWYHNDMPVFGATSNMLFISSVTAANAGDYKVEISKSSPKSYTTESDEVTLTVNKKLPAIVFVEMSTMLITGSQYQFSIAPASGNDFNPDDIEWTFSNNLMSIETDGNIATITTGNYAGTGVLTVNAINGCGSQSISQYITIRNADQTVPVITNQPASGSVCAGSNYIFSVIASGENLSYQWYFNNNPIQNATTNVLNIASATSAQAGNYKVIVSSPFNTQVESSTATLTVNNPIPELALLVESTVIAPNSTYSTSISPSNIGTDNIVWTYSGTGVVITPSANKTSATITTGANPVAGNLIVSASNSCNTRTISQLLNIATLPPANTVAITVQPVGNATCTGASYVFSVVATGNNLNYQWYFNNRAITQGGNSSVLNLTNITKAYAGSYYVVVGGANAQSVTSSAVSLSVTNTLSDVIFSRVPETIVPNRKDTVILTSVSSAAIEASVINWSFSNNSLTVTPIGTGTSAALTPGATVQSGTLRVTMTNSCGTHVIERYIAAGSLTGINPVIAETVQLYPNPVSKEMYINSDFPITSVVVTDATGRKIRIEQDAKTLGMKRTINVSAWKEGIYIVRVITTENESVHKVIKK
ncbi:hypothetical protein FACS189426_08560 [Bacteroidia bacterium]|nr:hypothetical protein FACS189426_08560 [Bacteroidia bacterium]GHT84472.1 hypothetical protein FACS18947_1990 [Bacteroidia bacterium]